MPNTLFGASVSLIQRALLNCINNSKLSFASPGSPTCWPTDPKKIPDLIDFCVTIGIPNQHIKASGSLELSSDHLPVVVTISKTLSASSLNCHLCSRSTNWTHFKTKVSNALATTFSLITEEAILIATQFITT